MTKQQQRRKHAQRLHHQAQGPTRLRIALEDAEEARKRQKKGKAFVATCMEKAGYAWDSNRQRWIVVWPMSREMRERVNATVVV